jgi:hypothetical protein
MRLSETSAGFKRLGLGQKLAESGPGDRIDGTGPCFALLHSARGYSRGPVAAIAVVLLRKPCPAVLSLWHAASPAWLRRR